MPATIALLLADPPLTGPALADWALSSTGTAPAIAVQASIGVLASVASGVGYGAANLLGGLAARRQPVLLTIACSQSVALLLVAIVAATRPGRPTPVDLGVGVAAGAAAFTGDYLAYRCFRTGQIGASAVLLGLAELTVPAAVAGLLPAAGRPASSSPATFVGLGLAAAAIVVLTAPSRPHLPTGARAAGLAFGAGAAFGGYHVAIASTRPDSGLWPVVAAEAAITAAAWTATTVRRLHSADRGAVRLAAGDGALSAVAGLAGLGGVRAAALPVVGALLALLPTVTTVLLARLVLRQPQPARALAGLAVAAAAITFLATR